MTEKSEEINNKPVIGILTLPLSNWLGDNIEISSKKAKSFLPAAYVQWIENSGARVVPIQYTETTPILHSYLSQLNGVVICGDISPVNYSTMDKHTKIDIEVIRWMKAEFNIFQWAKIQNNMGNYFPVLGIGMGYEELIFMELMPQYYTGVTSSKKALEFTPEQIPSDEMVKSNETYLATPFVLTDTPGIFKKIPESNKTLWETTDVCYMTPGWAMNAHGKKIKKITEFLEINSIVTNKKLNTEYINVHSFKEYPFYGYAFHPEAVIYNWADQMIPQTNTGVIFSQRMSEIFVNECRKNSTVLSSNSILIYNYTLYSTSKVLKILYPENWQTMQLRKHFTNSYFFGITKHTFTGSKKKTVK